MIVVTDGITLSRRKFREYDRLAMVFTRDFGRLRVRYIGVDRPKAKLRAFTEPFVRAIFRLYLRAGAEVATGVGGAIECVYPAVRADLHSTHEAFYCCELVLRLTPEQQPSPEKFDLLAGALGALEDAEHRWVTLAFGLRLLEDAGFGLRDACPAEVPQALWTDLHEAEWSSLRLLPFDAARQRAGASLVSRHIRGRIDIGIESERFLIDDAGRQTQDAGRETILS